MGRKGAGPRLTGLVGASRTGQDSRTAMAVWLFVSMCLCVGVQVRPTPLLCRAIENQAAAQEHLGHLAVVDG